MEPSRYGELTHCQAALILGLVFTCAERVPVPHSGDSCSSCPMTVFWRLKTRESLQPGSATVSLGHPAWHAGIPPSAKGRRGTRPASRPHPLLTMLDTAVAEMGQWGSPYIFFTVPSRPSRGRAVRITAGQPGPPHVQRGRCRGPGSRGTSAASPLGAPCPWLSGQLARTPPLDCPLRSDSRSGHRGPLVVPPQPAWTCGGARRFPGAPARPLGHS